MKRETDYVNCGGQNIATRKKKMMAEMEHKMIAKSREEIIPDTTR